MWKNFKLVAKPIIAQKNIYGVIDSDDITYINAFKRTGWWIFSSWERMQGWRFDKQVIDFGTKYFFSQEGLTNEINKLGCTSKNSTIFSMVSSGY